jgi:small conductance mechanosensitive channel
LLENALAAEELMDVSEQEVTDFFTQWSNNVGSDLIPKLIVSLLILIVGRWLARLLTRAFEKALQRADVDETLQNFFSQIIYYSLLVVVIVIALTNLGIPTTSLVAIIGASALAIGLALQDTLGNLASGVLIIMLRPYQVNDLVEIGDQRGTVTEVAFFHTHLRTFDNKVLLIPNSDVMDGNIINYSAMDWVRVDMTFSIGYDDDLLKAKQILHDIIASDERITDDPAPLIAVQELGDNSVDLAVRPYTKLDDMFPVRFDVTEQVKLRFDAEGISIPFPQRDVHLITPPLPLNGSH